MFFFPLINFLFLIILYFVHKGVFWIATIIEVLVYVVWVYAIYTEFENQANQMLYTFFLTGMGFIFALAAFFVAIFLNQKHLYNQKSTNE